MPDDLVRELRIPPPLQGLQEGLDPSLDDALYAPTFSPDLSNIRVASGKVQTRLGMTLWKALPGSGDVRMLADHYEAAGTRIRLAARGTGAAGALYDYKEGTDTAFQTTTGGTSLGGTAQAFFKMVTLNDRAYITDRAGALRKYQETPASGNQVVAVALPVRPSAAPTVRKRTYDILEDWASLAAWAKSNAAEFDLEDASAGYTAPDGLATVPVYLHVLAAAGKDDWIRENISAEAIPSHTIAFWLRGNSGKTSIAFQFGNVSDQDFSDSLQASAKNEWYPHFVPMGNLATINFKRFKCIAAFDGDGMRLGALLLPGRLQGAYRWRYTHYDPALARESEPSDPSNGGTPVDLSTVGVNNQIGSAAAFQKAAGLYFTSDSGTDATTTKIRIYRNGGVPALTKDSRGRDVWLRVGEVFDQATTFNDAAVTAGDTSFTVTSATNIAIGDWLVIEAGVVGLEEFCRVTNVVGAVITVSRGILYNHANGTAVAVAFVDNVANEAVDVTASIDVERDDPPAAARWVARSPDGRLWLANYSGKPTGIAVSNRATPERPADYEVFPDGVDPLTRRHPTQGWRFELGGDVTDEEIVWFGFFRGEARALTRRRFYTIHAYSQSDWGPSTVDPTLELGCIAGDTVCELNGVLYWVAPGPQVVRWDGQGAPEVISHQRINERLAVATVASWATAFAIPFPAATGAYYRLCYGTLGTWLDYNVSQDAWEPRSHGALTWRAASVRFGITDGYELYQVDANGNVYQIETGSTDAGAAIAITSATKRFNLGAVSRMAYLYLRLEGVTDSVTVTVTCGGSEYGELSQVYSISLSGSNDIELRQRLHRSLLGRWVQIQLSGSVSNRPAIREMVLTYVPVRSGRVSL